MKAQASIAKQSLMEFQKYCWSFYGPKAIYGNMFDHKLTKPEMNAACLLISLTETFEGDTFDREKARDILFKVRGLPTEYYS